LQNYNAQVQDIQNANQVAAQDYQRQYQQAANRENLGIKKVTALERSIAQKEKDETTKQTLASKELSTYARIDPKDQPGFFAASPLLQKYYPRLQTITQATKPIPPEQADRYRQLAALAEVRAQLLPGLTNSIISKNEASADVSTASVPKVEAQTKQIGAQTKLTDAKTTGQNINNQFAPAKNQAQIDKIQQETKASIARVSQGWERIDVAKEKFAKTTGAYKTIKDPYKMLITLGNDLSATGIKIMQIKALKLSRINASGNMVPPSQEAIDLADSAIRNLEAQQEGLLAIQKKVNDYIERNGGNPTNPPPDNPPPPPNNGGVKQMSMGDLKKSDYSSPPLTQAQRDAIPRDAKEMRGAVGSSSPTPPPSKPKNNGQASWAKKFASAAARAAAKYGDK
jgi:hypothetical protein